MDYSKCTGEARVITLLTTRVSGPTSAWRVETSGSTMLVVRRHLRKAQDIARKPNGRIWWFESRELAQMVADQLNAESKQEKAE